MSSNPSNHGRSGMSGSLVVVGLFAGVVVLFLVVFYGSRPRTDTADGAASTANVEEAFVEAMNTGKNYLDQGRDAAPKAIEVFQEAVSLNSGDADAHLNLANAHLLNNEPVASADAARRALLIDRQLAAGYYLLGCSLLRSGEFEEALKALQTAKDLDHTVNAVSFQLGRAHQALGQWDAAAVQFREVIQFDPEHGAAHYNLSQVLIRLGDENGAELALAAHQAVAEKLGAVITDPSLFEQCIYTEARLPFKLDQPDSAGISVSFKEATAEFLGDLFERFEGPVGILDVGHDGELDLFARNREEGFQLLLRRDGNYVPEGFPYPAIEGAVYRSCLVGDLQHRNTLMGGRQEDVLLLSDKGTQVFRVSPSGMLSDSSLFAQVADVVLEEGTFHDLDITGKLDLVGLNATNRSLQFYRNQGNFSFINHTSTTNLPSNLEQIRQFVFDDWDGDDRADLFIVSPEEAPSLWLWQREGGFYQTNLLSQLPASRAIAVGDLNNDLRMDVLSLGTSNLSMLLQGADAVVSIADSVDAIESVQLVDYDNDGWLDVIATTAAGLRTWRNRGLEGFLETTDVLGLATIDLGGSVTSMQFADLDNDCDSDLLITLADQSIKILRNEGGNQNRQLKLRLEGTRSNPSALGVKLEITSGGLRMMRTVRTLPIEIGMGQRERVNAIDPHWSDLVTTTDVELEDCLALAIPELEIPSGSCPYLYVWDGQRYRFITDLLGAAPLGLPVAAGKLIPADPDEFVWLGGDDVVAEKEGYLDLQITEELREVLYLDEAKLVVVDHPEDVEVYPTSKLVPRPPFPHHELMALEGGHSLKEAVRSDGLDVTEALQRNDHKMVSPVALRAPQLRGLAEAYHIDLDFGQLDVSQPLVLAMHGWLRFGGGMANMGASHHPDLPFPFPVLAAEIGEDQWTTLDVVVGAPAGKTKAMIVDLSGKLPEGTKRLRLSMAFEIHWDRIALMQRYSGDAVQQVALVPTETDLYWRGFSEYRDLPWDQPLSPDFDQVRLRAPWLITPTGWCTRYGEVDELITSKDNRLVIMNGGDALSLRFRASELPVRSDDTVRDYYLFTSGWDKDADPHVVQGWTVEPLPWHGMDDQQYGEEERPKLPTDDWQSRYNNRWVGQFTLERRSK